MTEIEQLRKERDEAWEKFDRMNTALNVARKSVVAFFELLSVYPEISDSEKLHYTIQILKLFVKQ